MTTLNAALTRVADLVLGPLEGLPPLAVIVGAALASSVIVLLVMRATSNQAALADVKRRIHAALLEMRLYNDDVRALLRAQGDVLRANASYVALSLVPLVVTAVPLTLAIAQLQAYYGYAGLPVGVPAVVVADVSADAAATLPTLEAPGCEVVGVQRYFPTLGQVAWRVVPREPGAHELRVHAAGVVETKTVVVDGGDVPAVARRSPAREPQAFVSQVLYPSEPPLDVAGAIRAIRVPYTERTFSVAGWELHWLIVYVAATFVFVLALRKPMGVVI